MMIHVVVVVIATTATTSAATSICWWLVLLSGRILTIHILWDDRALLRRIGSVKILWSDWMLTRRMLRWLVSRRLLWYRRVGSNGCCVHAVRSCRSNDRSIVPHIRACNVLLLLVTSISGIVRLSSDDLALIAVGHAFDPGKVVTPTETIQQDDAGMSVLTS